jgi:hypothetical protein
MTQKEIIQRAQSILRKYPIGTIITDTNDLKFVLETLLENHPNKTEKKGRGVLHIKIDLNTVNYPCFTIIRTDGTETALGIYKAAGVKKDNVKQACRTAIEPDITEYRRSRQYNYECDHCGYKFGQHGFEDTTANHVHHDGWEFEQIYQKWREAIKTANVDLSIIPISKEKGPHAKPEFENAKTIEDFRAFHSQIAVLKLLCKKCHHNKKGEKDGDTGTVAEEGI